MGTHINQHQLEEVERMVQQGAEPVDVYKKLAEYGDSYAKGAVSGAKRTLFTSATTQVI